jgi:hypothetical protein
MAPSTRPDGELGERVIDSRTVPLTSASAASARQALGTVETKAPSVLRPIAAPSPANQDAR